jgi:hypothetical protein
MYQMVRAEGTTNYSRVLKQICRRTTGPNIMENK